MSLPIPDLCARGVDFSAAIRPHVLGHVIASSRPTFRSCSLQTSANLLSLGSCWQAPTPPKGLHVEFS